MNASYDEIKEKCEKVFGIKTIFPYQWLVISNILDIEAKYEKVNCNDDVENHFVFNYLLFF